MLKLLKNKYFITLVIFAVWMTFFDQNSFIFQAKFSKELNQLKARKKFYVNQNALLSKQKHDLDINIINLEKLAREKYLMKRDDEDVFIVNSEN